MRHLRVPAVLGMFVVLLAACGSPGASDNMPTELGEGEGELNLVIWAGYAEDGSAFPEFDWVTPFEEETGCIVNAQTQADSATGVRMLQSGEFDGGSFSGNATDRLMAAGDVAPVNVELLENYDNVFEGLKNQPHNSLDGVPYGVPHGRGANLLQYRTDVVKPAPDSWAVVWDKAGPYKGKVTAYDSPIYIADAAVYLMATQPDLGIEDPYELDQEQFDAAVELLKAQRQNIGEYWSDYTKQIAAFTGGESVVGTTWQVITNVLEGEKVPVAAVLPKEGSTGWSDTWMISSQAKNPNCMYMWMNHIISPKANAAATEYFGEAPSSKEACSLTANKDHCTIFHADDEEYFEQIYYWKTPQKDCGDDRGEVCKDYSEWTQAWTEIKG